MAKHLIIKYWRNRGKTFFFIASQSKKGEEFGLDTDSFIAEDGFILSSRCSPEVKVEDEDTGEPKLYVCGETAAQDHRILQTDDMQYLDRLQDAVRQYNKEFESPHPRMIDVTSSFNRFRKKHYASL